MATQGIPVLCTSPESRAPEVPSLEKLGWYVGLSCFVPKCPYQISYSISQSTVEYQQYSSCKLCILGNQIGLQKHHGISYLM